MKHSRFRARVRRQFSVGSSQLQAALMPAGQERVYRIQPCISRSQAQDANFRVMFWFWITSKQSYPVRVKDAPQLLELNVGSKRCVLYTGGHGSLFGGGGTNVEFPPLDPKLTPPTLRNVFLTVQLTCTRMYQYIVSLCMFSVLCNSHRWLIRDSI